MQDTGAGAGSGHNGQDDPTVWLRHELVCKGTELANYYKTPKICNGGNDGGAGWRWGRYRDVRLRGEGAAGYNGVITQHGREYSS